MNVHRQIFELKALHKRGWSQLTSDQKRLWVQLVDAGVPVEKAYRKMKDETKNMGSDTAEPEGAIRADGDNPLRGMQHGLSAGVCPSTQTTTHHG